MRVWIAGKRVTVDPASAIGKGGEADVFALGSGVALKLWKPPEHPDLDGLPYEQRAARERLDVQQTKIRRFPGGLPARAVAPRELATDGKAGRIVGYTMPLVASADPLLRLSDRKFREQGPGGPAGGPIRHEAVTAVLRDLHRTLSAVHAAGVVVGDLNDLNVLVPRGSAAAHLIDTDSWQFGGFACTTFTDRFVDPLLCDAQASAPMLAKPHGVGSDWYAYAIMLMQSLLYVGPYGGLHRPARGSAIVSPGRRPLERVTVFRPDVRYPRPALPLDVLPDEILAELHAIFEKDRRGPFPPALLDRLRWRTCASCNGEYARGTCPRCAAPPATVTQVITVRGDVTCTVMRDFTLPAPVLPTFWLQGGQLWRQGDLGAEVVGDVLAGQTRIWVGERFGFGMYRAGTLSMAFVFDARRRGIKDGVPVPPIRGALLDADCVFADDRAWFAWTAMEGPRTVTRCAVVRADGTVEALGEDVGVRGAAAIGGMLLVPTDEGIVRWEPRGGQIVKTKEFPDTAPFVHAGSQLVATPRGLAVVDGREIRMLQINTTKGATP